jgi:[ribosomal protein S18]-alanine N-acetyltransferase
LSAPLLRATGVEAGEIARLVEIERASYSHPWSEQSLSAAATGATGSRLLALREGRDGAIAAYLVFELVAGELHVHNLAVRPDRRRQGYASRLLALVLDLAARRGAEQALLEVRAGNAAARALYERFGFELLGVRSGYYMAPVEDAFVLCKRPLARRFPDS